MATATKEKKEQSVEEITLESLRDGAASILFQEKLEEVLANIMDRRTGASKRTLTLTVEFFVNEDKELGRIFRETPEVNIKANTKLAPIESGEAAHRIRQRDGRHQLVLGL